MEPEESTKTEALNAIRRLPENANTEEMMYQLYVLENIRRGQRDAEQGNTIAAEEVLQDLQRW